MRWLSIDPATKTGIARWEGAKLVSARSVAAKPDEVDDNQGRPFTGGGR